MNPPGGIDSKFREGRQGGEMCAIVDVWLWLSRVPVHSYYKSTMKLLQATPLPEDLTRSVWVGYVRVQNRRLIPNSS